MLRPFSRFILTALAVLLVAPAFSEKNGPLGLPQTWQGDEPHYLVMIHSLARDGDLDLANNYASSHRGGPDAGRYFAGRPLAHQTNYWKDGHPTSWSEVFAVRSEDWARDAQGHPIPSRRPESQAEIERSPELPVHPPGLPLLFATLVWPLRGHPQGIEPVCVLIAALAMVGAMLAFHRLALHVTDSQRAALWTTAAAFLATPLWHYSRSVFTEGFLLLFTMLACLLVLQGRRVVLAGALIGLGMLMKPPFGIIAVPLALFLWRRGLRSKVVLLFAPTVVAAALVLGANWATYGSPWTSPQPFAIGNPLEGMLGLLLDPFHGLLPVAPIALVAFGGWPALLRAKRGDARMLAGVAAIYSGLMALWACWWGGWCYGPRLILPIVPLMMLGLTASPWWKDRRRGVRFVVGLLAAVSLVVNMRAAFTYWRVYRDEPLLFSSAPASAQSSVSQPRHFDGLPSRNRPPEARKLGQASRCHGSPCAAKSSRS